MLLPGILKYPINQERLEEPTMINKHTMNIFTKLAVSSAVMGACLTGLGAGMAQTSASAAPPVPTVASATPSGLDGPRIDASNGRNVLYAYGRMPQTYGVFLPEIQFWGDSQFGVNLDAGQFSDAPGTLPGTVHAGDDVPRDGYAVAVLDPGTGAVLRISPISPNRTVML